MTGASTGAGAFIVGLEGTAAAVPAALGLAVLSAAAHAGLGALQKGRHDPWSVRAAVDVALICMALPVALLVFGPPEPALWGPLAGAWVLHTAYKVLQAMAYVRGAYTVVYPVARGAAPLVTVLFAWAAFGEVFAPGQWLGVAVLSAGIFGLAAVNLRAGGLQRATMVPALGLAVATGVMIAAYTTWDAWGIRLAADPFMFLIWFFVADGWAMPLIWAWRRSRTTARPPLGPLIPRGLAGAALGVLSFGAMLLATRLDKVGAAVAVRETSVIFAALIGWALLREPVGPARAALMVLIGAGAAAVAFAR